MNISTQNLIEEHGSEEALHPAAWIDDDCINTFEDDYAAADQ